MFVGTNGLARIDFSTSTRRVTLAVLGRPITAHRFRHSQVTDELQRAEVTADVRRHGDTPRSQRAGAGAALQFAETGEDAGADAGGVAEESGDGWPRGKRSTMKAGVSVFY